MIKSIWYGNAAIVLIAMMVLFFGLPNFGDKTTENKLVAGEPGGTGATGATGSTTDSRGNVVESAMVAMARKYLERWQPPTGSVQISLAPTEVSGDEARWRVDGGAWQSSNAMVSDLPVGPHKISFRPLSEWTKPPDLTLNVVRKKTTTAKGEYAAIERGSVRVIIEPEELLEFKPQWRVDNNPWQNNGDTMEGILAGRHSISFKNVPEWKIPSPINVTVAHEKLTEETGIYELKPVGSLVVTLGPQEALEGQVQWKLDNGPWQNSGTKLDKISAGPHTVHAKQINEWWKPDSIDVVIKEDETTAAAIEYGPVLYGSVYVKINPEAAAKSGVQWRMDDNEWQDSNSIDERVVVGQVHKLYFNPGQDWEPMDAVDVELVEGQLAKFMVDFIQKTPPPPTGLSIQTTMAFVGKPLIGKAWIKTLADKGYKLYSVGEVIFDYKIESVTPGVVHFSKNGFKYSLFVPIPQIGDGPKAPPATEQKAEEEVEDEPLRPLRGGRGNRPIRIPGTEGNPIR